MKHNIIENEPLVELQTRDRAANDC